MATGPNNWTPQQNWQNIGGSGFQGTYTNYGGGGGLPVARSDLDFQRMGTAQAPQAEYPDGYLGTIRSRRDDRLLDSMKTRVGQKSYQRGVHKGERIDVSEYLWPDNFQPDAGLKRAARAKKMGNVLMATRFAPDPLLTPAPHLVNDGKANLRANEPGEINEKRAKQFDRMKPSWR
jgi:hypothetical protein